MHIRGVTIEDLEVLSGHQNGFQMPNIGNPLYISNLAIEDASGLLGAAFIHLTTETTLIFRKEISDLRKAKALTFLFEDIKRIHYLNGLEDSHVFLTDDDGRFERVLEKLGFVRATGTPMYYQETKYGEGSTATSDDSGRQPCD